MAELVHVTTSYVPDRFSLNSLIVVGFGIAQVIKDGEVVYDENETLRLHTKKHPRSKKWPPFWTGRKAELLARKDPDHDWRIVIFGPLKGGTWQRKGKNKWELIESNKGFA